MPTAALPHPVRVRRLRFPANQTPTSRDRASAMSRHRLPRSHPAITTPDATHTFLLIHPRRRIILGGLCSLNRRLRMRHSRFLRSCRLSHRSKPRQKRLLAYQISLPAESASTQMSSTRPRTRCTTASAKSMCITGITHHVSIPSVISACIRELPVKLAMFASILASRRGPCPAYRCRGLYNLTFIWIPPAHTSKQNPLYDYVPRFVEHRFSLFSLASCNSESYGHRTGTTTLLYCFLALGALLSDLTKRCSFASMPQNEDAAAFIGHSFFSCTGSRAFFPFFFFLWLASFGRFLFYQHLRHSRTTGKGRPNSPRQGFFYTPHSAPLYSCDGTDIMQETFHSWANSEVTT